MKVAKSVKRYVEGTFDYGVRFGKSQNFKLQGNSENNWVGSDDDMKVLQVIVLALVQHGFHGPQSSKVHDLKSG